MTIIDTRFAGPPSSANGGWACGTLASHIDGAARVRLRKPPPLDTEMKIERDGERVSLVHGETLIGEAWPTELHLDRPAPVSLDEATEASKRYIGFEQHPYPTCFTCGTDRQSPDGLRIFPGSVTGRKIVAAPWTVPDDLVSGDGKARAELMWAALDCPSWFGFGAFNSDHGAILLGELSARVLRRPEAGQTGIAYGWAIERDGRKIHTASLLTAADGEPLAEARATWIELQPR